MGNIDHIHIGNGIHISPNVQIYTRNHNLQNVNLVDEIEDVYIGDDCWLGANCIILPGVKLGDHVVVGAGAVVTKSFPEGWCVIAGNPAKKIKDIIKRDI